MEMECYTLHTPYPEERPRRQDPRLARRLLPLYGGELGGISDYCCAALWTEEHSPELGRMFDALAETELMHFRLLGRLIRDLGGEPAIHTRFEGGAEFTDPRRGGLKQFLAQRLRREQAAADTYRYLLTQTEDAAVRALLARIAEDEEQHAALFGQLYRG